MKSVIKLKDLRIFLRKFDYFDFNLTLYTYIYLVVNTLGPFDLNKSLKNILCSLQIILWQLHTVLNILQKPISFQCGVMNLLLFDFLILLPLWPHLQTIIDHLLIILLLLPIYSLNTHIWWKKFLSEVGLAARLLGVQFLCD